MSKMVVGMKRRPEIKPHRIDCGFLNTTPNALVELFSQPSDGSDGLSLGKRRKRMPPITSPMRPIQIQKVFQPSPPPIIGPTTNCPAEPPAIPNICVAPIKVAATEAGKFFVA